METAGKALAVGVNAVNVVTVVVASNTVKVLRLGSIILNVAGLGAVPLAALSVNDQIARALNDNQVRNGKRFGKNMSSYSVNLKLHGLRRISEANSSKIFTPNTRTSLKRARISPRTRTKRPDRNEHSKYPGLPGERECKSVRQIST